jgi:hypothetical protein
MNWTLIFLFFHTIYSKTSHTVELLVNPSFEDSVSNKALDWKSYDGDMSYNIICTNEAWSCANVMKKYNIKPFYGYWVALATGINNYTYSSMIYQTVVTDVNINRAETTSLYLQFYYSSSGPVGIVNDTEVQCKSPEIHVYFGGQHLYAGITNNTHNYTFVNVSVYQNWMDVETGMEFMYELLFPDPNCSYIPYLAVDNITLTWNYDSKNLFTEDVLLIVVMICVIIVSLSAAFFLIRRDNARKRRDLMDIPVFPSCDWIRYMKQNCCCKKINYELAHS